MKYIQINSIVCPTKCKRDKNHINELNSTNIHKNTTTTNNIEIDENNNNNNSDAFIKSPTEWNVPRFE